MLNLDRAFPTTDSNADYGAACLEVHLLWLHRSPLDHDYRLRRIAMKYL
ncbi:MULTISPECIES: hypothetical protein [unclassified Synechococcus]